MEMDLKEYRDFLEYDPLEDDLEMLEEIIETEVPGEASDEWVIVSAGIYT